MNTTHTNIEFWENELKKRWAYPYSWGLKQNDELDQLTRFIYSTNSFDDLLKKIKTIESDTVYFNQLENYALNRWYNFHSAMCIEKLFLSSPRVVSAEDRYDKTKDFLIDNIPFDHKTSIFPRGFNHPFSFAAQNPKELAKWLYINQSKEGRFHLKNRLFVVLYDSQNEHWKLKADLHLIQKKVETYLQDFHLNQLITLTYSSGKILTDIIFIQK